jgi:hypothetical protein
MGMDAAVISNWTVVICLALPHFLYAFIWFFPQRWRAMFPQNPIQVFENTAWLLKGAIPEADQFPSLLLFLFES